MLPFGFEATPTERPHREIARGAVPLLYESRCHNYRTRRLDGLSDVEIDSGVDLAQYASSLTAVEGRFDSKTLSGCRGNYSFSPRPAVFESQNRRDGISISEPVSPLDADATHRWFVSRSIELPQGQFCGFEAGPTVCSDSFAVQSISDLGAN